MQRNATEKPISSPRGAPLLFAIGVNSRLFSSRQGLGSVHCSLGTQKLRQRSSGDCATGKLKGQSETGKIMPADTHISISFRGIRRLRGSNWVLSRSYIGGRRDGGTGLLGWCGFSDQRQGSWAHLRPGDREGLPRTKGADLGMDFRCRGLEVVDKA